ncbi:TraR/DksA family transcriptional regulator [Desulfatirhabdium butyrativorans]|uniref:TraR/DksA family transcriptional regulator n=1 Tax=Desulfatirhabdium butyrativorans TaxID=340467 RepID=UPI0004148A5B|nr:TraR/DksA C4-type zinc finger protein [Desulfatirhabdium butyrativorans]
MQRIHAALARIRSGDYGLCTVCEEEIAIRRLETDPVAMLCIACASRQEQR